MGFVFILPIAAASAWILATTLRQIFQDCPKKSRLRLVSLILFIGAALGIWLCFFLQYKPNANYRLSGFPIPLEFSQLRDEVWVNSTESLPVRIGTLVADFLFAFAIPCLPMKISFLINQFKQGGDSPAK